MQDSKPSKPFAAIIVIIVCITIILGLVWYIFILKDRNASLSQEKSQFVSAVESPSDMTNWKTYTNAKAGFSIQYPDMLESDVEQWIYKEYADSKLSQDHIYFGPPSSAQGGYVWDVTISDKSKGCEVYGNQFQDKDSAVENVNIDGKTAKLTTVRVQSLPDWISKSVCITTETNSITISNGAVDKPEFVNFYKSFKFSSN